MANSKLREGLSNQVSSESLDTFLHNLPTATDLDDLAMDDEQSDSSGSEDKRHANVEQPAATMMRSSTVSIDNDQTAINADEASAEAQLAVMASSNAVGIENGSTNASINSGQQPSNGRTQLPITAKTATSGAPIVSGTVPEFLYQLFKMLTENNREVIEWADGKIKVHSPLRLQNEILHNYFRHSKFASFQRQLNYFGFRKPGGKGEDVPLFICK